MSLKLNSQYTEKFIDKAELDAMQPLATEAFNKVINKNGEGNDFLGWLDLPVDYDKEEFYRIKKAAENIKNDCDIFVVIGIGGSYLGARAAIEYVKSPLYNTLPKDTPDIYFTGNNISSSAISELLSICKGKDICVNVISKSGKTTEPAVAFRVFRELLENTYGEEEARRRIYVTTGKSGSALRNLCNEKGYESFVVPDDIGGRYSVLSAVGLLPIAVAGCDIDAMMKGAAQAREDFTKTPCMCSNDCVKYAALRNVLYNKGKAIEIAVGYDSYMAMMNEWWKQLYGESEGKDGKGLFPTSVINSTDLHSLGQIIQDGQRNIFETVLNVKDSVVKKTIPTDEKDIDELNYITEQLLTMHDVNAVAMKATVLAHVAGGVPNIVLDIDSRSEKDFGYMVYFFELACAVSGYILGVNPFNQNGVESYKNNMFALLNKKGEKFDKIREQFNK